jgi:hypothetical protein
VKRKKERGKMKRMEGMKGEREGGRKRKREKKRERKRVLLIFLLLKTLVLLGPAWLFP